MDMIDEQEWAEEDAMLEAALNDLRKVAEPPVEGENPMVTAVRAAGHRCKSDDELHQALTSFQAATMLRDAVLKLLGPQRKSAVGRNDPCPCGSGRKYKKCCLGTPEDAAAFLPYLRRQIPWEMLPKPQEDDRFDDDLDLLHALLGEAEELADVRFDPDTLEEFFPDHEDELTPSGDPDQDDDANFALLRKYLATYDETNTFRRFRRGAVECAAAREDMDTLRALATGFLYALLAEHSEGKAETPLEMMILEHSVRDLIDDEEDIEGLFEALLQEHLGHLLGAAPGPGEEELFEVLKEGSFLIHLPLPSVPGPFMYMMFREEDSRWDDEQLLDLIKEAAEALGPEDDRLLAALIDQGLIEVPPEADPLLARLHALAAGPGLSTSLRAHLFLNTFTTTHRIQFPWHDEILSPDAPFNTAALEAYADLLKTRGFPTHADRILACRRLLEAPA